MRKVIWFGNAGSKYGDFGISNLRIAAPALGAVARHTPLRLVVVSNDEEKFAAATADFPFPCAYVPWTREGAIVQIADADLCIVPNSRDRFSIGKSANRVVLALRLGVPVVATSTPAVEPLRPYVVLDDWEGGVAEALQRPEAARERARSSWPFIDAGYSPQAVANQWLAHLTAPPQPRPQIDPRMAQDMIDAPRTLGKQWLGHLTASPSERWQALQEALQAAIDGPKIMAEQWVEHLAPPSRRQAERPTVLILVDEPEDLDRLPSLRTELAAAGLFMTVGMTSEFVLRCPAALEAVDPAATVMKIFDRREVLRGRAELSGFDAILTLAAGPQSRVAHGLAHQARRESRLIFDLAPAGGLPDPGGAAPLARSGPVGDAIAAALAQEAERRSA